jgi:hypothetical protein
MAMIGSPAVRVSMDATEVSSSEVARHGAPDPNEEEHGQA